MHRNPTTGMASCKMYREVFYAFILGFFNNNPPLKCCENERHTDILVVYSFTLSSEAEFMNIPYNFVEVSGHNLENSQT